MSGELDSTVEKYAKKLEKDHETFTEHPTMRNAWNLAGSSEELLEVLANIYD